MKEENVLTRWKEAERSQRREPEECSFEQTFTCKGTVARGRKVHLENVKVQATLLR